MNININDIIVSVIGAIVVAGLAWFIWHKKYFMEAINKLKEYLVSDNRANKKEIVDKLDHQYDGPNGIVAQHRELHNDIQKVSDKIPDSYYFQSLKDALSPFSLGNQYNIKEINDLTNQLNQAYIDNFNNNKYLIEQINALSHELEQLRIKNKQLMNENNTLKSELSKFNKSNDYER